MNSKRKKYSMAIDTKLCVGCGACVVACKTENSVPEERFRAWVVEEMDGTFPNLYMEIRSERCNHCSNAPCVKACPTGASHFAEGSNIVMVDPEKCTGCKACMASCPYNARFVMPEGYVSKCTFCEHRVKEDLDPACASVCPAHAIHFGDMNRKRSTISQLLKNRKSKVLIPDAGTEPNIHYLT